MTPLVEDYAARLEKLSLKEGGHESREAGMCVMEAAAYIAGEPHSANPACACPVITRFLMAWNDALPTDEDRDRLLKPLLPLVVGTRAEAIVTATVVAGTCRVCGCTEDHACPGGCAWADESETLCTQCFAKTAPGLKRADLTECASCGGFLTGPEQRSITFCRVTFERYLLLGNAVRRAHGEDLLMGPMLASVLGADEDLAKRFSETKGLVCDECAQHHSPFAMLERINERAEKGRGA